MLANATITYDLSDYGLADFDYRRTKVWATNNVVGSAVIDTAGNQIHLGTAKGTLAADGTGSITVPMPGTGSNPVSWQTTIHVDYPCGRERATRHFGPFTITASGDLADLVAEQEVPAEYLTTVTTQLSAYATSASASAASATAASTSAGASATSAAASAALASSIASINTTDAAMKATLETPGSLAAAALTKSFTAVITPEMYGAVGDGTTDDASALQLALNAAAATGRTLLLGGQKTYATGTQLNLSTAAPTRIQGRPGSTIKALSAMTALLSKAAAATTVSDISIVDVNLDGDLKATRLVAIEQAHRLYVDGGIWKNFTQRGLALGEAGGQVYECEIRRMRVIGIDESKSGATPAAMPAYGLTTGTATTDNLFDHIEFKNCDVYVRDTGNANLFQGVHGFGYPFATTPGGTPDYIGSIGFDLAGFGARLLGCYPDTQKVGVRVSGEANLISGGLFLWLSEWKPAAAVIGIDITAVATFTTIVGNTFTIRWAATYSGIPIRTAVGSTYTSFVDNKILGAFSVPYELNSTAGNDTIYGNVWSGGGVQDVRPGSPRFGGLQVDGAAATTRGLRMQTSKVDRWRLAADSTAEAGSNAGSDLTLTAFSDAGAGLFDLVKYNRATGVRSDLRGTVDAYVSASGVSGAITMDARTGKHFVHFLTGNVTSSSLDNGVNGQEVAVAFVQDATGGRTVSWPTTCKFAGGVTPTDMTPNSRVTVGFRFASGFWRETFRSVEALTYMSQSPGGATVTMDATPAAGLPSGIVFVNNLTTNLTTATLTGGSNGARMELSYVQDATGGRTYVWPSACRFAGGVAPSDTTANTRTTVSFRYAGGQWRETSRAVAVPA